MTILNHLFIITDGGRRYARREFLAGLFKKSRGNFEEALIGFPNENRFSQYKFLELEDRIETYVKTGKDPQYHKDGIDLLDSGKIIAPEEYLLDSYRKGGEALNKLIKYILENNVCNVLSIYGLQKRNLDRTDVETFAMLKVESEFFKKWGKNEEISSNCNFKFVGDRKIFDLHKYRLRLKEPIEKYVEAMDLAEANGIGKKLKVYVLTPYDSCWEINQAIENGKFNPNNLVVKEPVDLIVRAGNAKTPISGGLPYQAQFAQFISVKQYPADFDTRVLSNALDNYRIKERESGL